MKWIPLKGFSKYEITRSGFVRTAAKTQQLKRHQLLKLTDNGTGHLQVSVRRDGKRFRFLIHRLIASIFLSNPENKRFVHHIDSCTANNAANNLQWCTQVEHMALHPEHPTKLDEEKVLEIRAMTAAGIDPKVIASEYGINRSMVSHIKTRRYWKHIGESHGQQVFNLLDAAEAA